MSQPEKVVRTIIDLANRHEVSAIQEHLADEMTFVNPVSGSTDKRGMELFHTGFFGGFPDAHYRIDRLTSQGDAVVVECTVSGTNLGEFAGAAPTRNKISVPAAFCIDVSVDRVKSWRTYLDVAGMMRQLQTAEAATTAGSA
jgi:predicted ester cyclase